MSELPGYSPYGVPPPPSASSSSSLAPSASTVPVEPSPDYAAAPPPLIRQPRHNLAGPIQTISLSDKQHDYFKATRTSPTTYTIALTTDLTPLYRVEVDPSRTADPAIQIFDFQDPFPLAAARMHPFVTSAAAICTREPATDGAKWYPFNETYAVLVVEPVPGLPAVERNVSWTYTKSSTHLTCTLVGSLFGDSEETLVLGRYGMSGPGRYGTSGPSGSRFMVDMVFEILRGGGLEYELGVVVQGFARIESDRRRNAKNYKGK